jgi:predicted ATPase
MNNPKEQENRVSPKRTHGTVRHLTAEDILSLEAMPRGGEQQLPFHELLVEGLLSFGEETHFEFGRLNILVGPNGSGKSNLIDCVRIFRYAPFNIQEAFKDSGFQEWLYKGVNRQSGSAFLQVTASVPELPSKICHQIKLGPSLNSRAPLEEVVSWPCLPRSRRANPENVQVDLYFVGSHRSGATLSVSGTGKRHRERKLGEREYDPFRSILSQIRDIGQYPEITRLSGLYASFRIYAEWTFGRNSNLRESTPADRSDAMLSESMNDLALALNGLEKTAAHEKIRVLLQELKETYLDYVTRILFGRVGLELVEAPFDLPLPAKRLSDGTLRFLALAAILLQSNPPPLICLEEPELGMHPDMTRMVAGMIIDASTKTQLIVTTHSEHLLTALQDDFDALFAFDAGLAGSIVRRFSREEYKSWREEHTLGELWTSGELGGNRW